MCCFMTLCPSTCQLSAPELRRGRGSHRVPERVSPPVLLLAPREQGVIDGQLRGELLLVVVKRQAEALGDGHQSARLRSEITLVGIRATNNQRQALERWLLRGQTVLVDDRVE